MKIINHRINTIEELSRIPFTNGVEIDVRDFGNSLILAHDPFIGGELLELYLKEYKQSTLIINSKSEGVENKVIELLNRYKITDYFFLDCSFMVINRFIAAGIKNFAVRFSEMESIETLRNYKNKADWVWIDCFNQSPLTVENYSEIKDSGFKICIVSPDLVGRVDDIENYMKFFKQNKLEPDAICVKKEFESLWNEI